MHLFPALLFLPCVSARLFFTAYFSPDCSYGKGEVRESPPDYCIKTRDRQSFQIDNDEQPNDWILPVDTYWNEDCLPETYMGTIKAQNHQCYKVNKEPWGQWGSVMLRVP